MITARIVNICILLIKRQIFGRKIIVTNNLFWLFKTGLLHHAPNIHENEQLRELYLITSSGCCLPAPEDYSHSINKKK
jgi:hypothetical protein